MFLTNDIKNVEDFLKALNFIAPKGTSISYFVTPLGDNNNISHRVADEAGYEPVESNTQDVPGITDTLVFTKKSLRGTHSTSPDKINAYSTPPPMPKNPSKPELLTNDIVVSGGAVESPEKLNRIARVIESNSNYIDIQLQEDFCGFPAFTMFHCVRG